MRRRGFLLIETLAALFAASVFLSGAMSLFCACAGLVARSHSALSAESAKAGAVAAILSGEQCENAESCESIYADGIALRRITLKDSGLGRKSVIVLPDTN